MEVCIAIANWITFLLTQRKLVLRVHTRQKHSLTDVSWVEQVNVHNFVFIYYISSGISFSINIFDKLECYDININIDDVVNDNPLVLVHI